MNPEVGGKGNTLNPFAYPMRPHRRKHGPQGYADYSSCRPWLRDEFCFRCVYCLSREKWFGSQSFFDLDHAEPQVTSPGLALVYDNLVYACRRCNLAKGANLLPNPDVTAFGECLRVKADGDIMSLNDNGIRLIDHLVLDDPDLCEMRRGYIHRISQCELVQDIIGLRHVMGFPISLPDLGRLQPPRGNTRENGKSNSWYQKRLRNELPEHYE